MSIDAKTLAGLATGGTNGNAYGTTSEPAPKRENEDELWRWLEQLATESERVRREEARFDEFDQRLDIYNGKHWPDSIPSFRPPVVANELRTLVLSEAQDLTESQLRVYITKDPKNWDRDEAYERAFRAVWVREQVDLKLMYACVWALTIGTGFIESCWDPDLSHGMGDVAVRDVDPRYVLPDPDAVDDRKWLYVMTETVLDIPEIRRLWPLSGHRVRPDEGFSLKDKQGQREGSSGRNIYLGPLAPNDMDMPGVFPGYKKARARVLNCVVRDDATETVIEPEHDPITGAPKVDEKGNPVLKEITRAKYPKGRRIVGANGVILYDGESPHPSSDDFGMLRVVLDPPLGRFWGTGFVQQTGELQMAADKGLSSIVENGIRLNNGIVVSTTNTGLDWESFAGIPAQIVQINPGSEFKIQYPPPMPADMVQFPFRMLDLQKRLLGFEGTRSGAQGRGNVSPDLAETEISQAQSPTRLRARMLYYTVQRLAEMIFARMAYGYTTERNIPAVEGEKFSAVKWKPLERPDKWAVYVDPASFTVMSRTMLKRLGLALFKLRAIPRESLLEAIGWPDWQKAAKTMSESEAMAAAAKMKPKSGGKR